MEDNKYLGFTPDYIDSLLPNQIFVFGSNALGYHTGGASGTARKKFGAVWGQAEGLQGQSYAIPVDFGRNVRKDSEAKAGVYRFIDFAKEHPELFFFVTRVGCGIAGYHDDEMALFFKDALNLNNVSLPKSFVDALRGGEINYNLERFLEAQETDYSVALREIQGGKKSGHWIWFIFPQVKGPGHSYNSEFYGISGTEETKAYLNHPVLGLRLREITMVLVLGLSWGKLFKRGYTQDEYGVELARRDSTIEQLQDSIRVMQTKLAIYEQAVKWFRNADEEELQRGIEQIRSVPNDVPLP